MAWQGYEITTKYNTRGIFLNLDSFKKFIQTETALKELNALL